jgi:thiol:disulfide interchange protein DsbD
MTASSSGNRFVKIHSLAELEQVMQANSGKKVMLDFYAEWCTSCKELEHNTFSDPAVATALQEYVLIQADVTSNSDEERALSQRYGVFGPPTMIFFDQDGNSIDAKKLVGYKPPEAFLEHLHRS